MLTMKTRLAVLAGLLFAFTSSGPAAAATYFLDPVNGSTSCSATGQTGCNATACRSWQALLSRVTPGAGDVVNFCSGAYRETISIPASGASGQPLVLRRASDSAVPVINATDTCSNWTSQGNGVYSCPFTPQITGCSNGIQKLFIDGSPLIEAQADGCPSSITSLPAGHWCYNSSSRVVYVRKSNGTSPAGNLVEVGSRTRNISMASRSWVTVDGLTLFGAESFCTDRDYAVYASSVGAGIVFRNNTMRYSGAGMLVTGADNAQIVGNRFEDIGQGWSHPPSLVTNGLFLLRTQANRTGMVVTGNVVVRAGTHNWAKSLSNNCGVYNGSSTAPCYMDSFVLQSATGRLIIKNNVLSDVEGGIVVKLDTGAVVSAGSEISGNRVTGWKPPPGYNAYAHKLLMVFCEGNALGGPIDCTGPQQPSPRPIVRELKIYDNVLRHARIGLLLSVANLQSGDAYTVRAYNNFIQAGDRNYGNDQAAAMHLFQGSSGLQIYNNTVQCMRNAHSGGSGLDIGHNADRSASGNVGADFRNNIFDFDGCATKIVDLSSADTWNESSNLCDVASSGRCVSGANALTYVDEANGDLHLSSSGNTSAVNRGVSLANFNSDIDGQSRPVGTSWDIGADELATQLAPGVPILYSVTYVPN